MSVNSKIENMYKLSSMQKGMLYSSLMNPESKAYYEVFKFIIRGEINQEAIEESFNKIIKRHGIFRTIFKHKNVKEPVQIVLKSRKIKGQFYDVTEIEQAEQQVKIEDYIELVGNRPYDFEKDSLIRLAIFKLEEEVYQVVLNFHHIVLDGWCVGILMREWFEIYRSIVENSKANLMPAPRSEVYYEWLKRQNENDALAYWKEYLQGYENTNNISNKADTNGEYLQKLYHCIISRELYDKAKEISAKNSSTINTFFNIVWGKVLQRYINADDVLFGSIISGRPPELPGIENMIGVFINTVPIRVRFNEGKTFSELLRECQEDKNNAMKYSYSSFAQIQSATSIDRNLIDHIVVFENYPIEEGVRSLESCTSLGINIEQIETVEQTNYNLNLVVVPSNGMQIEFKYNSKVFTEEFIKQLSIGIERVFKQVINQPDIEMDKIEVLPKEEMERLVQKEDGIQKEYATGKTLEAYFEEAADKYPENTAIVFSNDKVTYNELNEQANKLAWELKKRGIKEGDRVGILLERGVEVYFSILAILKAGGVYVPINDEYPDSRIEYMLHDCAAKLIITHSALRHRISNELDILEVDKADIIGNSCESPYNERNIRDNCYIIYTSGSTGQSKGTLVQHQNVLRVVKDTNYIDIKENDCLLQLSNYAFDGSVFDIFGAFLNGAKLVALTKEHVLSPEIIAEIIKQENVTIAFMTTALFNVIVDVNLNSLSGMRKILFGGERVSVAHVKKAFLTLGPGKLMHVYGPTETAVYATWYSIDSIDEEQRTIPIGTALTNTRLYILDNKKNPLPVGVPGELYIGGTSVSSGYLNQKELTDERFIENPWVPGEKIYKTGDQVKYNSAGEIEFLDRVDNQVKIRGFRVELGEIENEILKCRQISEVIVTAIEEKNGNTIALCAYYVSKGEVNKQELQDNLSKTLPQYMLPSYYIELEEMPLTTNKKIDKRALPKPDKEIQTDYISPNTEYEKVIAQVWAGVLGQEMVSVNSNFFDIGGHSLNAMNIVSMVNKNLGTNLTIKELFLKPTIRELASYLESSEHIEQNSLEKAKNKEFYPISSQQKRMFAIWQNDKENIVYNMPSAFFVEGKIDIAQLEDVINIIVERHSALRTIFPIIDGIVYQKILPKYRIQVQYSQKEYSQESSEKLVQAMIQPFDLENGPLVRVSVTQLKDDKQILFIDIHHIISDGVTTGIVVDEMSRLFNGEKLDNVKYQYVDFSEYQTSSYYLEKMKKQEEYWINQFSGELPILSLLQDYKRKPQRTFGGRKIEFFIEGDTSEKIKKYISINKSTSYIFFAACISLFLKRFSGQDEFIIGSPFSGRTNSDIQGIVGMFVNTIAFRTKISPEWTVNEYMENCKKQITEIFDNQDYQFDDLLNQIKYSREAGRNPLFDIMFAMQNVGISELMLGRTKISGINFDNGTEKFDITFQVFESDKFKFEVSYNTDIFKHETVMCMMNCIKAMIRLIISDMNVKIEKLNELSEKEIIALVSREDRIQKQYDRYKTLDNYFEEMAETYKYNTSVTFNSKSITYGELNAKANQLAWELKKNGIKEGDCVGILLEKGIDVYISVMAVLKAGGVYVPINKEYPDNRIEYILKDCYAQIMIICDCLKERICFDIRMLVLDKIDISGNMKSNPTNNRNINDICYIMYTSGSTGQSKGTLVKHQNVIRVVKDSNYIDISEEDCLLQLSNYAFDGSVFDIFGALLNGAKLVAVDEDTVLSVEKIAETIEKENVTISFMTTALFNVIVDTKLNTLEKMKKILFGGERVSLSHVKKGFEVLGPGKMLHVYGPTETAVFATFYPIDSVVENQITIPIGTALTNTRLYILDDNMRPVPDCVAGELYIGGSCVSEGYLNRDDLTEQRFLDNPWKPGEKIYRSGDLVRFNAEGHIEFLDRIDNQVKIRGFRIELGEIENEILKSAEVLEATITAIEDENGNTTGLCAYYVLKEYLDKEKLKLRLSQNLPQYMIPGYFIELEAIPLTTNNKIDKSALPKPGEKDAIRDVYVEPQSELEKEIAEVWTEVLGMEKISVTDNFFDIGGDSIKGIQIISKLKDKGIGLEIKYLLSYPTISQLCGYVVEHNLVIAQGPVIGKVALSPIQEYFFEEHKGCNINHFCQSVTIFGNLGFDPYVVKKVMDQMAEHHDALRMIYCKTEEGVLEQSIRDVEGDFTEVKVISVKEKAADQKEEVIRQNAQLLQESISLEAGQLFKALVIKDVDGDHLYLVIHHFVVDGVSWRYLVEDFCRLYKCHTGGDSYRIPPKTSSYKEWVEKQQEYSKSEGAMDELEYWNSIDISEDTLLKTKSKVQARTMARCSLSTVELDSDTTSILLTEANKAFDTKVNVLLLAALMVAVKQWNGMEKLAVNLEGHGREDVIEGVDLSRTVGWFTSVFPVILNAEGQKALSDVIMDVNQQLNKVPNHGVVYGMLKYLNSDNLKLSKTKPNVCFNYLGEIDNVIKHDEFSISPLNINCDIGEGIKAMYSMDISCVVKNKKLIIHLLHSDEELSKEQIEKFLSIFVETLKDAAYLCAQVVAETKINIDEIDSIQKQPFVLCLNEILEDKLFVFPPHMPKVAYSIVYKNLSRYIKNYSFYMFNFLETEKIVDHYVEKVKELQKNGPYVLMGYSFGGALAFEVAYRLISEGCEVSDIILIDSYVVGEDSFSNIDLDFVRENVINSLNYQYSGVITNEGFIKEIADSFINYYMYTKDFVNTKNKLPTNIHLIRSSGFVPNIRDTRDEWKELTSARYIEYAGIGEHNEMLSGANLNHNGKIVVAILNEIKRNEIQK